MGSCSEKAKSFFNKCILPALMQATPCEGESSDVNDAGDNCVEGGVGGNCVGDAGDNCVEGGVGGNSVGVGGNSGVGDAGENCVEGGVGGNSVGGVGGKSGVGDAGENCVEGGVGLGGNSVGGVGGNSGVGDTGEKCVTGGMGRNSIEGGTGKNCVEGGVGEKAGSDCPLGNNKRGQPHTDRAPLSPPKKGVKSSSADEKSYPLFCCCRDIEHRNMVCCDNENCVFL